MEREDDTAKVYYNSCYACKLYGNTKLRGRIAFSDAFPESAVKTETRYSVPISRLTNAVARNLFEMEIVVSGSFRGYLTLQNFEVWQLGLLALTMKAINDGLVKIGFGKNRGFGEVKLKVTQAILDLATNKVQIPGNEIWGVGAFMSTVQELQKEIETYGLHSEGKLSTPTDVRGEVLGIFVRRIYDAQMWKVIAEQTIKDLPKFLR